MRVLSIQRYDRIISLGFNCFSIILFLLLVLSLLGLYPGLGNLVMLGVTIASSVLLVRAIYVETQTESYDLAVPSVFESGILSFKSCKEGNAVFFTFRITSHSIEATSAVRTLTILLKIIPISTICSFEWLSRTEYFINFFIKMEKEAFLTRIKELIEGISTTLTALFNTQHVHMLRGEELMTHFSMGIAGFVNRVKIGGKNRVILRSDIGKEERVFSSIYPLSEFTIADVFNQKPDSQYLRVLLSFKREETDFALCNRLVLISNKAISYLQSPIGLEHIVKIPAGRLIQFFGDILSRNFIDLDQKNMDYQSTARFIFNQITSVKAKQEGIETPSGSNQIIGNMSPKAWRRLFTQFSSPQGLQYSKDAQIMVDGVPVRCDAKVGTLFLFIISQNSERQIQWLVRRITTMLKTIEGSELGFLVTNPIQVQFLRDAISQLHFEMKIHIITEKQGLDTVLNEYQNRIVTKQLLTQVA